MDFKRLRPGQIYRTIRAWTDFDRANHPVGEEWSYLGHSQLPHDDGLTLKTIDQEGHRRLIRLQDRPEEQRQFIENIDAYLQRAETLPTEQPLYCLCHEPAWIGSAAGCLTGVHCTECEITIGMEQSNGGGRILDLDPTEREELSIAIRLSEDLHWTDAAAQVLALRSSAAMTLGASKLLSRDDFWQEMNGALRDPHQKPRLLALTIISRMQPAPDRVGPVLLGAMRQPLNPDPTGIEQELILHAICAAARSLVGFPTCETTLQSLRSALSEESGGRAEGMLKLCDLTLETLSTAREDTLRQFEARWRQLHDLVGAGNREGAMALLHTLSSENEPGSLVRRQGLLEAAGDQLMGSDPTGGRFLLEQALSEAKRWASMATSGGEGMARMSEVNRLKAKLSSEA